MTIAPALDAVADTYPSIVPNTVPSTVPGAASATAPLRLATDVKRLANAFCHAQLLLSADELGLFADLAGYGPSTVDEIRERLGLHGRGLRDFLHGLVLLGLLDLDEGRYTNQPVVAETLVPGADNYIGGFLRRANRMLYPAWGGLAPALRSGEPNAAGAEDGAFLRMLQDPAQRGPYLHMMDSASSLVAPHLAEVFDWAAYRTLVDVGGCRGNLAARMLVAHPHLTATVFDLPPMAVPFAEHLEALGVAGRGAFQGGDFFNDELVRGDVVVLGHVLHNWSVAQREALVARAYAAVRPGGALLIYDAMVTPEPTDLPRTLVSLNMLLVTQGGSEYTAAECQGWLAKAGCEHAEVRALGSTDTLVIGHKPA